MKVLSTASAIFFISSSLMATPADWAVSNGESIQAAILQASPGDRILVGPGSYPETLNYGGKDLEVIAVEGPDVTILGDPGLPRCVDHYLVTTTAARLEGFTLVAGDSGQDAGSCIRVQAQSALTVRGCQVAGAGRVPFRVDDSTLILEGGLVMGSTERAILAYNSTIELDGMTIENCSTGFEGGGIYQSGGQFSARDCLFSNSTAAWDGGACFFISCTVAIEGTTFQGCTAGRSGGAVSVNNTGTGQASILASIFDGNHSFGPPGSIEYGGGAIHGGNSDLSVEKCVLNENRAARSGGAIHAINGSLSLLDSKLTRNAAVQAGEAVNRSGGGTGTIHNSIFFDNGDGNSGDVEILWNGSSSSLDVTATSFAYNSGTIGRGASFTDCIFWGHGGQAQNCSFTHCDVQGGAPGTGNFDLDPLFLSYAGEDFNVQPTSPCLGAGVSGGNVGATLSVGLPDCNGNGISDALDSLGNDCDGNGVPDECDPDCNENGAPDACDLAVGTSLDLDGDGIPDECSPDCDQDSIPDFVELLFGSADCNANSVPDECEADCDGNGIPDDCDVTLGGAADCNGNLVLDVCEVDCDENGVPDECDLTAGASDCNGNGIPDLCDLVTMDCNGNGLVDTCDIAAGTSLDLDGNGIPDECKPDCNLNGIPDPLDIQFGFSQDCNGNGAPDECDLATGVSADCDGNAVPDSCQIDQDPGLDLNANGVLDSCECGWTSYCVSSPNSVGAGALISASGSSNVSQADFTLMASQAPPAQFGIFFYAAGSGQQPLLDGTLCVSGNIYRLPAVQIGGSGEASYLIDYAALPGGGGEILAGSTWHFQFWYRDPSGGPSGSNLSNGLEVDFCP